jgi:molybdenum cofactor cytidylyltransferase
VVSAIVLAAGAGRRFGADKPLALLGGKPLVRHVIDALQTGGVAEIIVVVRPPLSAFNSALEGVGHIRTCVNTRANDGMSSSLRLGLDSLNDATRGVLIALADQPTIQAQVVRALIHAWSRDGHSIVAPSYRGERGHPVLFDAALLPELRAIEGDRGARQIIERDARRVQLVAVDAELPRDVDTAADLQELERLARS